MKTYIHIVLIFLPCWLSAQYSFVKSIPSEYEIREIMHLTQLSNGNYCVKTMEDDITAAQSNIQRLYLFDPCGKYLHHLEYLHDANTGLDTFHSFENIIDYDSRINVAGLLINGLDNSYYLQLDPNDLSIIGDISYLGKHPLLINDFKVYNDTLYQISANDVDLSMGVFYKDMKRKSILTKENWDPDFRYYSYQDATKKSVFSIIVDAIEGQHISISDYFLDQTHLIKVRNDSIHRNYQHLVLLDDSTFICNYEEVNNGLSTDYVAKYKMDEELSARQLVGDEPGFERGLVQKIADNTLHIFTRSGWHRRYDLDGNFISEQHILPDSVTSVKTASLTVDGGIIAAYDYWNKIDNTWFVFINLIKFNGNWELAIENDACFTSTSEIPLQKIHVTAFPNPTSQGVTIECDHPFHRLTIYKNDGSLLLDKHYQESVKRDQIDILGNGLFTIIVHDEMGNKISTRVLKI